MYYKKKIIGCLVISYQGKSFFKYIPGKKWRYACNEPPFWEFDNLQLETSRELFNMHY